MEATAGGERVAGDGTLTGAGASIALHVFGAAVLALVPVTASPSGPRDTLRIDIERVARSPIRVVEEEPPDEPEGGREGEPVAAAEAVRSPRSRPRAVRGRGRGRASGDAQGTAPRTAAAVTLGEPEVVEIALGISRAIVYRTLGARAHEVRRCAAGNVDLFATVVVEFTVGPDGRVTESGIARSTLGDADVLSCMTEAVRGWTFPPAPNGGSTSVAYPFVVGPFDE